MFIERLELEASKLASAVSVLQMLEKIPQEDRGELSWGMPYSRLRITSSCFSILELASAVAKAGYRECDALTLDEIKRETFDILHEVCARDEAA
ncbi:hypothetical protein [Oryzifoliimicrobium ureilyticus]|uniref:hypothetical protein n=1 Tax=Oryzifoliimicrobium ureilyticus TaxID=3113724 RepID=UPI0030765B51